MTQAQLVAYVAQGLAFRTGDQNANILAMATLVQYDELEKGTTLPRFLMKEDVPLAGTANVATVSVPGDFIREYMDAGALKFIDTFNNTSFLNKKPYDWLVSWTEEIEDEPVPGTPLVPVTGNPAWYSLRKSTIYISPIPTTNFTLYMTYYAHDVDPASLASGASNLWLANAPGLLANLVGVRMAEDLEYDTGVAKFSRRFEASMARLMKEEAAAEAANQEFVMGELV
jgi:hypothetical protein